MQLPRELARLPELIDLRLDDCPALNAKQAAAHAEGGAAAVLALLAAKAARSDAKLALAEVLIYQASEGSSSTRQVRGPHLLALYVQLYTGDASTDAGKLRVLALVKAVVASFKGESPRPSGVRLQPRHPHPSSAPQSSRTCGS